jgi:hypothetical protein
VSYVHVVFTIPHELSWLALQNKKVVYDLLFRASAATLMEIAADPKHLGAEIGFLSVLHTWGQTLPRGFVRIRFCGYLANRRRCELLPLCRRLLEAGPLTGSTAPAPSAPKPPCAWLCPRCGSAMVQSRSLLLDRSAGDRSSGRASLTLHSRRSSTNNPLAPAGAVEVCANLAECPNATPKSTLGKLDLVLPSPSPRWQRHIRTLAVIRKATPHVSGVIQHPYLPRPPQTRAASSNVSIRSDPAVWILRHSPAPVRRVTPDRVLAFSCTGHFPIHGRVPTEVM